jgi:uncharacterized NAD(P)/FAD-binding protein YdhS
MDYSSLTMLTEAQSDLPQLECYDIAIVGAGVSSAYTLVHYIARLEQQAAIDIENTSNRQPIRIVVTEKSGEFWTGMPYGSRSGRYALLISPLHEFIPQQPERANFVNWLTTNRDRVFNPHEYNQSELSRKWLQANVAAMSQGLWDDLFIPRSVFGLYVQERLAQLLETATVKGLIEFKLITADVLDVQNIQGTYQVDLAGKDSTSFLAKQLVLAIGSPPNVAFENAQSPDSADGICYINNVYEPSLSFNLDRICKSLAQTADPSHRQVLMIGSNAGTLDTLYSVNNSQTAVDLIDKFIVLSPNAAFPHRISKGIVELNYQPQHLLALVKSASSFTAKEIFIAVKQDVAAATAQNINISDIHGDISKITMQALAQLNPAEQKQFVIKYAVEIGKYQRRAGGEYLDVVNSLVAQAKLEFVKGKFVKYAPLATGGSSCEYLDSDNQPQSVDVPISVVINCAGFQDVTKSSSILIQNLIRRNICTPNDSNRGFVIDKNFKANHNCYVMGPLVAGNIDGAFKIWHAESCQRIISLSEHLAATLHQNQLAADLLVTDTEINAVEAIEHVELLVSAT